MKTSSEFSTLLAMSAMNRVNRFPGNLSPDFVGATEISCRVRVSQTSPGADPSVYPKVQLLPIDGPRRTQACEPKEEESVFIDTPLRILLVDDNEFTRRLGSILLEKLGHRVEVVADGAAAFTSWKANEFDLVLMDIQMPGMDGFETTHRIREFERGRKPRIPIIALTGDLLSVKNRSEETLGMDGFLTKPLDYHELRRMIEQVKPPISPDVKGSRNRWSLDPDEIRAAYPMSSSAMATVVTLFRESCADRLGRIRDAIARKDGGEVARQAHALKGSLGMFATSATLQIVFDLESEMKNNAPTRAKSLLGDLETALAALQTSLDQLSQIPDEVA